MKIIICIALLFIGSMGFGQDSTIVDTSNDSVKVHSPRKAAIYSTALPGLGQIYNKKYWYIKVPVIYGGFAGIGYMINYNQQLYIKYRNEYRNRLNDPSFVPSGDISFLSNSAVKLRRDSYRRYRDMNIMMAFGWYGINILEAAVSAHLLNFDVSDDLSLKIQPYHQYTLNNQIANGISLRLSL